MPTSDSSGAPCRCLRRAAASREHDVRSATTRSTCRRPAAAAAPSASPPCGHARTTASSRASMRWSAPCSTSSPPVRRSTRAPANICRQLRCGRGALCCGSSKLRRVRRPHCWRRRRRVAVCMGRSRVAVTGTGKPSSSSVESPDGSGRAPMPPLRRMTMGDAPSPPHEGEEWISCAVAAALLRERAVDSITTRYVPGSARNPLTASNPFSATPTRMPSDSSSHLVCIRLSIDSSASSTPTGPVPCGRLPAAAAAGHHCTCCRSAASIAALSTGLAR
mmetsp:Transcript_25477/g.60600  ORF Transcript_25477/g.60600 Transcript_25477/m.60600 type:complete len:277 (-) Transcript_25477:2328-3158(-)